MTSRASPSAPPSAARSCPAPTSSRRRRPRRHRLVRRPLQRLFAGPQDRRSLGRRLVPAGPLRREPHALGRPAHPDPHLCEAAALGAQGRHRHQGPRPHHRRRLHRQHPARPARDRLGRTSTSTPCSVPESLRLARPRRRHERARDAAHLQLRRRHALRRRSAPKPSASSPTSTIRAKRAVIVGKITEPGAEPVTFEGKLAL